MPHEAIHNAIRTRFETEVATPEGVPVLYDNAPGEAPKDVAWIRWNVVDGTSEQADFGATVVQERTIGRAVAEIRVPVHRGDREALRLADVVKAAFRRTTADGIKYRVPEVRLVGRDGAWWWINVSCPWQADEFI